MKQETTTNYEAPQIGVLEVEVEQGFAVSNNPTGTGDNWGGFN